MKHLFPQALWGRATGLGEHTYSDGTNVWDVRKLWGLAKDLPKTEVLLEDLPVWKPEEDGWNVQGLLDFVHHVERVLNADLSYPILLSPDGWVMDGVHRIAKARLQGIRVITAIRFEVMPPPEQEA